MKKILIINPFGIGDVLFTTPVVKAVRKAYPDSFICYWCNERVSDLLKADSKIDKVTGLSRGDLKKIFDRSFFEGAKRLFLLYAYLKKEKFDISLDFSLDHRYSLISKIAKVKRRVGFNYKNRGKFLTDKVDIKAFDSKHIIEYYLDLLKLIEVDPKDQKMELEVPDEAKVKAARLFSYSGINNTDLTVGIAPGAGESWGKDASLKHWPSLRFAQLADRIIAEFNAKVVFLGSESERPISEAITNMMKNKPVDLTGKTTLRELAACIQNLKLLIANDGGPLHMGVALGKKTVSIFGPVDEKVYGPYPADENNLVVKYDLACRPCYKNFRLGLCASDRECIKLVGVDDVFSAVRRLL